MICDDTLGGFTAIDARRFGEEFIKRRRAEKAGVQISTGQIPSSSITPAESLDKFVPVLKKRRGKQ